MRTLALIAAFVFAGLSARAAELEVSGSLGYTLPFYDQTFPIDLRPPGVPVQGIELRPQEPLRLNAKGALAYAGTATLYFGPIGIEGRYDSARVDITAIPPVYSVRLSSPFPNVSTTLTPAPTDLRLTALTPVSLNLKLRTTGPFRLSVSGGVSYLPEFQLIVRQPIDLRVGGLGLPALQLGSVLAEAISQPQDPARDSRIGANAGVGLRLPLSDHAGVVVDARAFVFPEQVLEWRVRQTGGPVTLPPALLQSVADQLEPVRFNPAYFHLQAGIALSF
ncbi:MAG: hypothetical protein ABW221_19815 [Vicinamibacteria bacterium]